METRAFMEPRFNHDFGRVRVHADDQAAESARSLGAAAYTVGQHVVFNDQRYQPLTRLGRELIAHELAHTIQQEGQNPEGHSALSLTSPADASEREAAGVAASAANGTPVAINSRQPVSVQQSPDPTSAPHLDLAESASPIMAAAIGSFTLDGFATGKAEIPPNRRLELDSTARNIQTLLKKYPGSTVRVIGHTDAIGTEEKNQTLGQQRADAVQGALVEDGVSPDVITTESKGESELLLKTQKPESRNRRVQVRFHPETRLAHVLPDTSLTPPEPPSSGSKTDRPGTTLPDPSHYKPTVDPPPAPNLPDWFWKPLPQGPKKSGKSLDDLINSAAKKITSFLPKSVQEKAQELVKSAIEKGITAGLDSALQSAGVDQNARQAIGKATEAAIKQKLGGGQ
jgi:outer membrane protein OmpA-like peptidoglycan-associated protein